MSAFSLHTLRDDKHSKWYCSDADSRIPNEFAAAAFRFGHSTIPTYFYRDRAGYGSSEDYNTNQEDLIKLRTAFFNPSFVQKEQGWLFKTGYQVSLMLKQSCLL